MIVSEWRAFFFLGKIEKTDWNVKEIEKKIEENKYGRGVQSSAAKVPKWNRQQFDDKVLYSNYSPTLSKNCTIIVEKSLVFRC